MLTQPINTTVANVTEQIYRARWDSTEKTLKFGLDAVIRRNEFMPQFFAYLHLWINQIVI